MLVLCVIRYDVGKTRVVIVAHLDIFDVFGLSGMRYFVALGMLLLSIKLFQNASCMIQLLQFFKASLG